MKKLFCLAALLCFSFVGCSPDASTGGSPAKTTGAVTTAPMGDAPKVVAPAEGDAKESADAVVGEAGKETVGEAGEVPK